jgi:hypothetical protein
MFIDNDHRESALDQLGQLADEITLLYKQDWRHEYEQCKETWKSKVIREQEHGMLLNQSRHRIYDTIINTLQNTPNLTDPFLGSFCLEQDKEEVNR